MSSVTTSQRQLVRRDERRAQILRAAAQAFSRDGFSATSVDEVAKQAGITKLVVYRHFDSKADLYRAILAGVADRLAEVWVEVSADPESDHPGLLALFTVAREMPDAFRLLFVHAEREQDFAGYAAEFRQLQEAAVDEVVIPALIPAGPQRVWLTHMLVQVAVSAVLAWIDLGDPSDDDGFIARSTATLHAMVETLTP